MKNATTGFIEIVADYVLSIIGKKMNVELTHGRRRTAYVLMSVFLLIGIGMGMGAYAIYSLAEIILRK